MSRHALRLALFILSLLFAPSARAAGETESLSLPGKAWALEISLPGFVSMGREVAPDGSRLAARWMSERDRMIASIYLEPAAGPDDKKACREYYWTKGLAAPVPHEQVKMSEKGDVAFVDWWVTAVKQRHVNAYLAKEGVWIDVHISQIASGPDDQKRFDAILDSIRFSGASAGPAAPVRSPASAPVVASTPAPPADAKYRAACEAGDLIACLAIADFTSERDFPPESPELETACRGGKASACAAMGAAAYRKGDKRASLAYADRACRLGDKDVCIDARDMKGTLDGVTPENLMPYMKLACDDDLPAGCRRAADAAEREGRIPQASRLYQLGCTMKDGRSCTRLANLFRTHKQDWKMARNLSALSCELNDAAGCFFLGIAEQTLKHDPQAMKALDKACGLGLRTGCDTKERLAKRGAR